jgi:hypothetical protein
MRLWLSLRAIEMQIAALLALQGVLLNPLLISILIAYIYGSAMQGIGAVPFIVGFAVIVTMTAIWNMSRFGTDEALSAKPLLMDLDREERLQNFVRKIAADTTGIPRRSTLVLSPRIWHRLACDPARLRDNKSSLVIPIGCLALWSVFDFSCYIAHSLLRRRTPWIVRRAKITTYTLGLERFQDVANRRAHVRARLVNKFGTTCASLVNRWELLADIAADRHVARRYGASTVADCLQRYYLAEISVPACLNSVVAPAASRGQLLPIAESCRLYHAQMEPNWLASLRDQMSKAERGGAKQVGLSPVLIRLGALQNAPEVAQGADPRPAAMLFQDLPYLEEATLRDELGPLPPLHPGTVEQMGVSVLIPHMQDEVARNAKLLAGQKLSDIPDLIGRAPELAAFYCEHRGYLLAAIQRQAMIPHLLTAFLVTELMEQSWQVSYTVEAGLTLGSGGRRINPHDTIRRLSKGELSAQEFLALVNPAAPSRTAT